MRLSYVRFTAQLLIILTFGVAAVSVLFLAAPLLSPAHATPPTRMTLLETLAEWKYPDSNMPSGAVISDGGNPLLQSVKCAAVLTTPHPIEKEIEYFADKFGTGESSDRQAEKREAKKDDPRSISVQDDSKGRPVTLRVFVVNKADTSTTLVISRAEAEKDTLIAWSHYQRFGAVPK
jgi:hypothetical protein